MSVMVTGFSGCVGQRLEERLDSAYQQVGESQDALRAARFAGRQRLDWETGSKLVLERNSGMLRARENLERIEQDRRRFVLDQLDPRLRLVTSLGTSLGELASLGDDAGVRAFGTINFPNPLSLYARRYALELQHYQARQELELLRRRLLAELYGAFLQQKALDQEIATPPRETRELLAALRENPFRETSPERDAKQRQEGLRLSLNRLLDSAGYSWKPQVSTLPDISYAGELGRLDPEKGYGRLALRQAAGQIEAGMARVWQVKVARLPSFNTGVSLPSLYDSRSGDNFSAEDVGLFTSFSESFDLNERDARNVRQAENRAIFIQQALRLRLEREFSNLQRAKENYQRLMGQKSALERRLSFLEANPPGPSGGLLLAYLEEKRFTRESLQRLELAQSQLDLQFWIWDEEAWK